METLTLTFSELSAWFGRAILFIAGASNKHTFLVDTVAMIFFCIFVGMLNEMLIARMTFAESCRSRSISIPANLLTGGLYGFWYNLLKKISPLVVAFVLVHLSIAPQTVETITHHRWFTFGVGFIAFITFQRPLYRIVLKIAKTPAPKIERALGVSTIVFPLIGEFLYSPYLEWCRIHAPKFLFL